ncbi:MAG: sulfatase-like hydrolase/transferase [Muribaculum sp.]|nr:sulfatase-like hydrolase/transferase [Muribaculaceae bacterium]MCM1081221.1 sulfatase-like hydrolase/transferase [Muribaculum sp.]
MKNRLLRFFAIFFQLVVIFMITRAIFLCVNNSIYSETTAGDIFNMFRHGLGMDMSMAGYFTLIPGLAILATIFLSTGKAIRIVDKVLYGYFALVALVIALATTADALLYPYWGFKLDTTPLFYFMSAPSSAMASSTASEAFCGLAILIFLTGIYWLLLSVWVKLLPLNILKKNKAAYAAALTVLTAALFLPIRGGVTVSTMNLSSAYFSPNQKLNHGAVNPLFSFMYSATHQDDFGQQFRYFDMQEAKNILSDFYSSLQPGDTIAPVTLSTDRPDIYLVILESFSAHLLPSLGGDSIAMNLDSIARNGVLFTNLYASSFRTDRALPAILSGYPGQPTTSIMKFVEKTDNLPSLPRTLGKNGYRLSYYYGGDVNFTNMKAYLVSAGFNNIVCDKSFPVSERLSKWGVHDDKVFSRQLSDLHKSDYAGPQFTVIQTSSSHEPFQVPYKSRFENDRINSFAYADNSLGRWIDTLRTTARWDSTLVVIVPDHYSVWPRNIKAHEARHHVPLVLAGGAITSAPMRVENVSAQTDLAATLLGLLGIDASDFPFSNNALSPGVPHMAFFSEPELASIVTATDTATISVATGETLSGNPETVDAVKAYLQILYNDIQNR